jgi:hypothetical protein
VTVWPHSLAYFNELAGGPQNGYRHLGLAPMDTNLDCGQDLLLLRWWLDAHPEVKGLRAAVICYLPHELLSLPRESPPPAPPLEPERVRVDMDFPRWTQPRVPSGPQPGWYALSVVTLWSPWEEFAYFRELQPVARIGYTINVYHIDLATANRLRRKLGLELLPEP